MNTGNHGTTRATHKRRSQFWILLLALLLVSWLTGCSFNLDILSSYLPAGILRSPTPQVVLTTPPPPSPEPPRVTATPELQLMTLWVPPQFDPRANTVAGNLLKDQLEEFVRLNPQTQIRVRVKSLTGSGGLLESLTAANAAAPSAVPSLVLLSRSDLETAALKSLVYPLNEGQTLLADSDWYPYARDLALVDGSVLGVPFAGDALLMVYRTGRIGQPTNTWAGILGRGQPVVFPAADPQALLPLSLYRSIEGKIQDEQGRPYAQPKELTAVLELFSNGARSGVFPTWLTQIQTDGQAWQAYNENRSNWLVTWSSRYLTELPADSSAIGLPPLGDQNFTLASGWLWAVSEPLANHRSAAEKLAIFLADADFLAEWSDDSSYLPVRPTSLSGWNNQTLRSLANQVVLSAEVRPGGSISTSLGPIFAEAVQLVIKNQNTPEEAAQIATDQLTTP